MQKINKLIISHRGNILSKYGSKAPKILGLLEKFRKAARKQQMTASLVFLDDDSMKSQYGIDKVINGTDPQQFKDAVDKLYQKIDPDYIVLIGAQDIIPFQPLKNPARRHDDENEVPSDLPYACEQAFSIEPKDFVAPSRVVGRIPDIPGNNDPAYLSILINNAINWTPRDPKDYRNYFALSTVSWKGSTRKNIAKMFGSDAALMFSPLSGPSFTKAQLKPAIHFFNCHGALEEPTFYGEKGKQMPEAFYSKSLINKVSAGTIAAAECCYGAQLYDINETSQVSIANTYLQQGAIAFMGSTNVAYGPSDNLALADLITQFFLVKIFEGASTGRALLEARLQFLNDAGPYLDVIELKTIAQFILLGDPSIHPVKKEIADPDEKNIAWKNSRTNRRENLKQKGVAMGNMIIPPVHYANNELPMPVQKEVKKMLKENGMLKNVRKEVYVNAKNARKDGLKNTLNSIKYIAYSTKEDNGKIVHRKILMVKEKGETILGSRIYVSK
jgi:hypothetical protein